MADDRVAMLADVVEYLAEVHHSTIRGSRLHDPESIDFRDCPCRTCQRATAALRQVGR